jgi:hypothetical protein
MIKKTTFLLYLILPLFCMAQGPLPREYSYDAAGNRTSRIMIRMETPLLTSPPPEVPDPVVTNSVKTEEELTFLQPALSFATTELLETEELTLLMPPKSQDFAETYPEYFIEKIAQVEMKIYPNPTTEKITLQISNMENLQTGTFKLFSMNGQLLQEQPVHSVATTVSLAGLSKGAYILKVHINHHTEDWKIIKQ